MSFSVPSALWIKSALAMRLARYSCGVFLGLSSLAWVVDQSGEQTGSVVVHVVEANVMVKAGPHPFVFVEQPWETITWKLPPGEHTLIMTRDGRVLYEETFRIERGQTLVLMAWDPKRLGQEQADNPQESCEGQPERQSRSYPSMTSIERMTASPGCQPGGIPRLA